MTALAGSQFAASALAADNVSTNSEAAEIAALKKEIQALEQKVETLEQQQQKSQAAAAAAQAPAAAQVEALDQKDRILEREREDDQAAAADLAKNQPKFALTQNGFSFSSSDSNFVAELHGVLQADTRSFFNDGGNNGDDGFLLRRARPIFTGTVFHDFDFNFTPDFGGSTVQIFDAYVNYHYNSALQLQVGKFKAPVGLEALVADRDLLFNERSLATDLVPNRELGAEFHGGVLDNVVSYGLGVFSGGYDYTGTTINSPSQDDLAFEGRLIFQPLKNSDVYALRGLGFGVAGTYLDNHPQTNSATGLTPGYTTDGQEKFFTYNAGVDADGAGWRVEPQAYYYYGPLGMLGEYVVSDQQVGLLKKSADLQNTAWEVTGSWVLTGEDAAYTGVTPLHPFDPRTGGWGAWQLVGRYASLSVDSKAFSDGFASPTKSADGANAWAVGLNWYLNRNIRADLSFSHTWFDGYTGKAAPGVPAQPENVLFSRFQIAF
ncbi:MAG TPA: porin [Candidatus Acidoferrales bacterium]|nr:porin [Candidatus Acidoferrales bacterium]